MSSLRKIFKAQYLSGIGLIILAGLYPYWTRAYTVIPEGINTFNGRKLEFYPDTNTMFWALTTSTTPLLIAIVLFVTLPKRLNPGFFIFLGSVIIFQGLELYYALNSELNFGVFELHWYFKYAFVVLITIPAILARKSISMYSRWIEEKRTAEVTKNIELLTVKDLENLANHFVKIEQGIISITDEHEARIWKRVLLKYVNNGYSDISTKLNEIHETKH